MPSNKTDNHNPAAKLALRRYFLRKYHAGERFSVLDCCQGSGLLWGELRREFSDCDYWGVDLKPKSGRLKIDSVRILAQPGWTQNVIDIDTYGSPFKHWAAMLPNVTRPLTVFLTFCVTNRGVALTELEPYFGRRIFRRMPLTIKQTVCDRFAEPVMLGQAMKHCRVMEAAVFRTGIDGANGSYRNYYGVRLCPRS